MFGKREKKIVDDIGVLQRLFNSEEGKIVLHGLMKTCHFMDSTFSPDPYEAAFNEGQRSVIARILKTINTAPEDIMKIMEQGKQRESEYED